MIFALKNRNFLYFLDSHCILHAVIFLDGDGHRLSYQMCVIRYLMQTENDRIDIIAVSQMDGFL